jgi:hypothetical protein
LLPQKGKGENRGAREKRKWLTTEEERVGIVGWARVLFHSYTITIFGLRTFLNASGLSHVIIGEPFRRSASVNLF